MPEIQTALGAQDMQLTKTKTLITIANIFSDTNIVAIETASTT